MSNPSFFRIDMQIDRADDAWLGQFLHPHMNGSTGHFQLFSDIRIGDRGITHQDLRISLSRVSICELGSIVVFQV